MKVVFLHDVPNVAKAGEVKEVAEGYARNYLLPKKLAAVATSTELKRLEEQHKAEARRQAHWEKEAGALAEELRGMTLTFKRRAGAEERLYGSVTNSDIAEEIKRLSGREIDKHRIELEEPIRELGSHQVPIKLTKDITAAVTVVVEAEGE